MSNLPEKFLERMKVQLHTKEAFDAFLLSYDRPTYKGLRVNTLKLSADLFKSISPFTLSPIPWEGNGFYVEEEKVGRHPYHFAGLYYSQEPSAMSVVPLLNVQSGERVLDLCAAPGGKSTQIAQALCGHGCLVSNEINGDRAKILSQNIERLGVKNAVVTSSTPEKLAARFPSFFDKILVDAPCSGEGMFKKNEKEALENWSEENVALCARRQKDILESAATMLCSGGRLVYSTCTFAPEEDEEQITSFLKEHEEFTLREQKKLYPHEVMGEGHFYAVLEKSEEGGCRIDGKLAASNLSKKDEQLWKEFVKKNLAEDDVPAGILYRAGDGLYILPEGCPALEKLPVLRAGIKAGEFVKDRFEPGHALGVCLKKSQREVHLSVEACEKYLRGETVEADVENGWCLVFVEDFPLGWGKTTNGTVKNHYPKGLRLMK